MKEETHVKLHPILQIPMHKMPRHLAVIMDGNGRWAEKRGLARIRGHHAGSKVVSDIVTEAVRLGLECLTLYCFSTENWNRSPEEVTGLMSLFRRYLINKRSTIMKHNIRIRHLGSAKKLPGSLRRELQKTISMSKNNTKMTLCLAVNYSGREEILTAIKRIIHDSQVGKIRAEDINESNFNQYLNTAGLIEPDLVIRTASEMRISNFMLWQISYAELYVTDVLWPDFAPKNLHDAIYAYANRERRFGTNKKQNNVSLI